MVPEGYREVMGNLVRATPVTPDLTAGTKANTIVVIEETTGLNIVIPAKAWNT